MGRHLPPVRSSTYFEWPPSPQQLHTDLIDSPFLNQKTYKDIRISYLLKHKHSKKCIPLLKKVAVKDKMKIQESSINHKNNNPVSVMLCVGVTFVKKNPSLVDRIVSFDTVILHLLTFRILEPYPSRWSRSRYLTLMTLW